MKNLGAFQTSFSWRHSSSKFVSVRLWCLKKKKKYTLSLVQGFSLIEKYRKGTKGENSNGIDSKIKLAKREREWQKFL